MTIELHRSEFEKVLCEMLSPRGCSDGDRLDISNLLGLQEEAEQISDEPEIRHG